MKIITFSSVSVDLTSAFSNIVFFQAFLQVKRVSMDSFGYLCQAQESRATAAALIVMDLNKLHLLPVSEI